MPTIVTVQVAKQRHAFAQDVSSRLPSALAQDGNHGYTPEPKFIVKVAPTAKHIYPPNGHQSRPTRASDLMYHGSVLR